MHPSEKNVNKEASFEHQSNLGTLLSTYGPKRTWKKSLIGPLIALVIAIILIITGLDWYYYGFTQYGPTAALSWSKNWLIWGTLTGIITLLITTYIIIRSQIWVGIYRHGVTIHTPLQRGRSVHWENCTGIASATVKTTLLGFTLKTQHKLIIYPSSGKPIIIDDHVESIRELTTVLKANVYPRLLPKLLNQLYAGQPIKFGPITVLKHEIIIHQKIIPRKLIKKVTIIAGHLCIKVNQSDQNYTKEYRIRIDTLPNLELFTQLIKQGSNTN